ncbi:hypothetical protein Godav_011393 [Gossypium davidsonii]|uniref:PPM-type phosphatase domain-containing protein n=1 Tax=Gossypium davidsonii TaxID=34287 RepID=A0A7J8R9P1_GOSDV|nr:hypothetical protein [Gossypium davidsonii]
MLNESKSNGLHSERGIDDRDSIVSSFIVKNVQFLITKDILGFMEVANRESSQGYFLKIVNSSEKFEEVYPMVLIKKNKHVEVHDSYWFPLLAMERNNGVVLVGLPNKITFGLITMMNDGCVMKNEEAVNLVKSVKDPQAAAKLLTTEALARKSKDDISCIVIRFG